MLSGLECCLTVGRWDGTLNRSSPCCNLLLQLPRILQMCFKKANKRKPWPLEQAENSPPLMRKRGGNVVKGRRGRGRGRNMPKCYVHCHRWKLAQLLIWRSFERAVPWGQVKYPAKPQGDGKALARNSLRCVILTQQRIYYYGSVKDQTCKHFLGWQIYHSLKPKEKASKC